MSKNNPYEEVPEKNSEMFLNVKRVICYIILIIAALIALFPFVLLLVNATRPHAAIQQGFSLIPGGSLLNNLKNTLATNDLPVMRGMFNSFLISALACGLSVYFSAFTAYGIHVYDFKIRKPVMSFIMLIMMVPTQVSALGFVQLMMNFKLTNSLIPLIIPTIAAPATYFFMKQYMESALPLDIVEAARIDGSNELKTFNRIIMPIMKPAIAVQAIFTFATNWNNYFLPALLLTKKEMKTLPVLIAQLRSADYLKFDMGKVYFLIAFSIIPVVVVYLLLSKFIIRGVALGSVKG